MKKKKIMPRLFQCVLATALLTGETDAVRAQNGEAPRILQVDPKNAITTPGAKITISGLYFSPESKVYFGGLQARETILIDSTTLQATTPYLRPGTYKLDLQSDQAVVRSDVVFGALPAPIDSSFDRAEEAVAKHQAGSAIDIFGSVAATDLDYDVRAYAHYRAGQLYLAQGKYWLGAEQAALIWDPKVSRGVQTSWRYRLLYDETAYSFSESNDRDTDLRIADSDVKMNVTESPEPRFWRALVNARFARYEKAREDLKFILAVEPENPSYLALANYIGVLAGDKALSDASHDEITNDARALALLGQAAYLAGDFGRSQALWTEQAKGDLRQVMLDCAAGRKHLGYGQTRVASALLAECGAVAPESKEAKKAKELLASLHN